MPRLIDDLRARDARLQKPFLVAEHLEPQWIAYTQRITDLLRQEIPVLLIDNVAEFYFTASDQEHWDLVKDFPNLAPPYKTFWCEHKLPKLIHSKEKGDTNIAALTPTGRVGALITAVERHEMQGEDIPDNVRWVLWCDIFIDYNHHEVTAQGPHGATFFALDANGILVDKPWMQSFDAGECTEIARSLMTWFYPALLAISFLHCKNVMLEDNHVPRPLAKKYQTKHGVAPCTFKRLIIEPLKQILRTEGRSGEVGLAKSMHICRGHFADYREGRGLFGKYNMLVWLPQMIRGTRGKKAPAREVEIRV